jgi:hypothetical protein
MILFEKILSHLYFPVAVVAVAIFLTTNGLSAWLGAVYLLLGLFFGWFLISVYLNLAKTSQASLILFSAFFQASFLLFSFWLVISNEALVASGIVLGVNLFFIKGLIFDYQKRRTILKKKLFNNIEISDRPLLGYLVSFILLVALLIALVIL